MLATRNGFDGMQWPLWSVYFATVDWDGQCHTIR
jgi:hypothetical protein